MSINLTFKPWPLIIGAWKFLSLRPAEHGSYKKTKSLKLSKSSTGLLSDTRTTMGIHNHVSSLHIHLTSLISKSQKKRLPPHLLSSIRRQVHRDNKHLTWQNKSWKLLRKKGVASVNTCSLKAPSTIAKLRRGKISMSSRDSSKISKQR